MSKTHLDRLPSALWRHILKYVDVAQGDIPYVVGLISIRDYAKFLDYPHMNPHKQYIAELIYKYGTVDDLSSILGDSNLSNLNFMNIATATLNKRIIELYRDV